MGVSAQIQVSDLCLYLDRKLQSMPNSCLLSNTVSSCLFLFLKAYSESFAVTLFTFWHARQIDVMRNNRREVTELDRRARVWPCSVAASRAVGTARLCWPGAWVLGRGKEGFGWV